MTIDTTSGLAYSQLQFSRSYDKLSKNYSKLSSGLKLENAADDPSDYALSNHLRADAKMLRMSRQNAFDGLSYMQVTDGILDEATHMLTRIVQLATQAASGHTGANGRNAIDQEYQALIVQLDQLNLHSEFNDVKIFGSSLSVQFGDTSNETLTLTNPSIDASALGLSGSDMTTPLNAENVLQLASGAIDTLSSQRSVLGAKSNRLRQTLDQIDQKILDTTDAESKMRDLDVATEITKMTTHQMQHESAQAALSQGGLTARRVLSLLQ